MYTRFSKVLFSIQSWVVEGTPWHSSRCACSPSARDPGFEAEGVAVKDYSGGLFAVTRVQVKDPWEDIPPAWGRLVDWVAASEYELDSGVCFEKSMDVQSEGEFILDLYCPVKG